jgi:DNA-binding LacI/PurR family transcriptional regulator
MPSTPVTIRDVADAAGVSISTVSRALKNQRGLSDATRRHVRQVARKIGYDAARLRSAKAARLVFMVHRQHRHFASNPFFSDVLQGVEAACREAGLVPTLLSCGPTDPIREQLRLHEPDMILAAGFFETEVLDLVTALELPVALVDFSLRDLPAVNPDNETGGFLATRHLLDIGRRRIAYIAGPLAHTSIRERAHGYRRALFEAGMLADPELEATATPGLPHDVGAAQAMQQLLRLREPPDAVFACNDAAALAAIGACHAAGLQVPRDVAVVGFDDIRMAAATQPSLTTLRVDRQALGRMGVELLLHGTSMPRLNTLPVELVVRQSTGGR